MIITASPAISKRKLICFGSTKDNNLESLTSALDLFYFPSSFKNRKNFKLLNSSHVMLRAEALVRDH